MNSTPIIPDNRPPDKPRLTGNKCLCRSCGRYFGGVAGFDAHRRAGQCVPPETIGMAQDAAGFWRRARPDAFANSAILRTTPCTYPHPAADVLERRVS